MRARQHLGALLLVLHLAQLAVVLALVQRGQLGLHALRQRLLTGHVAGSGELFRRALAGPPGGDEDTDDDGAEHQRTDAPDQPLHPSQFGSHRAVLRLSWRYCQRSRSHRATCGAK
jgi:hypothetical protein